MQIKCDITGEVKDCKRAKDGSPKLPRGWKQHGGKTYSATAWKDSYVMRGVSIPIQTIDGHEWKDFAAAIHAAWKETTRLSNYIASRLYVEDMQAAPVDNETGKLPKMPVVYLYPETASIAPSLSGTSRSAICQQVDQCYRSDRFSIRARNNRSLRNYRYPQPLPVTKQAWSLEWREDGRKLPTPQISLRLAGQRWPIVLRNDAGSRRAIQLLQRDDCIPAAIAVEARRIGTHKGLPTVNIRDAGGQNQRHYVSVRIALWVPREKYRSQSGTLYVRTDKESLLVALNAKDERLWVCHADHIRRWVRERDRRKDRLSDDRKAEQRPVASFQSRSTAEVVKFRKRMSTACHEIAEQAVRYAARRRMERIEYDDSDTGFVDHFPWYELKDKIKQKCERQSIAFLPVTARKQEEASKDA